MKLSRIFHRLGTLLIVCLVLAVLLLAVGAAAYASQFSDRAETPEAYRYSEAQFPALTAVTISYTNHSNDRMSGCLYTAEGVEPDGLIVFAHGMGCGHRAYLNVISFFADNGYAVFAYDASGYDSSGGTSTRGVQQAVLDLDAAITVAELMTKDADLPVFLFGHSLGAYAACAVLAEHPEVRAVASLAGFNSTADLLKARYGFAGLLLTPGALLWERLRFGSAAEDSAMKGFAASDARVLIVHSSDDNEVPIECGLDLYASAYESDPRFTLLRLDGKGHGGLFTGDVPAACLALFDACKE
ncbi:MAG: alpha/beta fold hydrolase [Oscillospiraceae bacterium]|nr:alpha/beta fold hydrolase [Oscillospiraceae bacterium]